MRLLKRFGPLALISKQGIVGDALSLSGGTVLAQGIAFAAFPVLTRLYDPLDFGLLAIYLSFNSMLAPLITGRYAMAIVLPEKESDAIGVFELAIIIAMCAGVILSGVVFLLGDQLSWVTGGAKIGPWIFLFPLGITLGALYQTVSLWATRRRCFQQLGINKVYQVSVMVLAQFAIVWLISPSGVWLIAGHIAGVTAALAILILRTFVRARRPVGWVGFLQLKKLLVRYKDFPLYMTWGGLLNSGAIHITPIMLAVFFSSSVVGYYGLAFLIITAPISLIGRALSNAILPRMSEQWNADGNVANLVGRILPVQALVAGVIAGAFLIAGPTMFGLLFGQQWRVTGEFVRILSPVFFMQLLIAPVSLVLVVAERQRLLFGVQAFLFLMSAVPILVGGYFFRNEYHTLMIFSAAQVVAYGVYLVTICRVSSVSLGDVVRGMSLNVRSVLMSGQVE